MLNWKSRTIIGAIVILLGILTYLEIKDADGTRPLYVHIFITSSFIALLFLLFWQEKESDVFPQVGKFFVAMVPLFVLALYFLLSSTKMELSLLFTTIFSVVSLLGLAISMAVLVRVREVVGTEMDLLLEATKLVDNAHSRLIFISLSLNIGYASAVSEDKFHLTAAFEKAFENALSRLVASGKSKENITIAFLNDSDVDLFLKYKATYLQDRKFYYGHGADNIEKKGDEIYLERSKNLIEIVSKFTGNSAVTVKRYNKCLRENADNKVVPDSLVSPFPPLGILIVDDAAIISYNISVLEKNPAKLKGHITREKEQVEAIKVFSETYLQGFTT